MTELVKITN